MFDLVCFFFIYLPVMNVIRDSKDTKPTVKIAATGALLALMASYISL